MQRVAIGPDDFIRIRRPQPAERVEPGRSQLRGLRGRVRVAARVDRRDGPGEPFRSTAQRVGDGPGGGIETPVGPFERALECVGGRGERIGVVATDPHALEPAGELS